MDEKSRYLLCSLERALQILNCFSYQHPEWGVTELAKKLGMNKSTVHRMLITLEAHGAVEKKGDHRYSIGVRLFELGNVYRANANVVNIGRPLLEKLSHEIRATVRMSRLKDGKVTDILKFEYPESPKVYSALQEGRETTCTAAGKVLLSRMPESELRDFVNRYGMPRRTLRSISSLEALQDELKRIRAQGYALGNQELADWLRDLAVPIFDDNGCVCGALNVVLTLPQLPMSRVPVMAQRIKFFADRVSRQLGYVGEIS